MAKKKYDWLEIEKEYVTSQSVTYKELAERFGTTENYIMKKGNRGKWSEKRKKHFERIFEKTCNKIADKTARDIAKAAENLAAGLKQASEELFIHEEINMFGKLIKKDTDTVRVPKLSALVKSLTMLEKIEIEKEKLEILKKQKVKNVNTPPAYFDDMDEELDNEE